MGVGGSARGVGASGYALTGGGAEVHWNGAGILLWKLEPATARTPSFSAAAEDHHVSGPSTITAYSVGICID